MIRFRGSRIEPIRVWGNSWRATTSHAANARGAALFVRLMIAASALLAAGCVSYLSDSSRPWQWMVIVGVPGIASAVLPDSHFGLVVVAGLAVPWLIHDAEPRSPWSLALGVLLAVFHVSMAAASAAPGAARWTAAMSRQYVQRVLAASGATAFTWMVVIGLTEYEPSSPLVAVAALLVLAVGAVWARTGALRGRP